MTTAFTVDGCHCCLLPGRDELRRQALQVVLCDEHKGLVDGAACEHALALLTKYRQQVRGKSTLIIPGSSPETTQAMHIWGDLA